MLKFKVAILAVTVLLVVLPGCKPKGERNADAVNPELVTNPITASGKKAANGLPVMSLEQTKHDFGMMVQGEKLSYTFVFTNKGGSELIISDASVTCGCTIADFTKSPVKPGDQGKVEVIFNSAGKSGSVSKSVRLLTNCQPNYTELEITAEVYVPNSKK